MYNEFNNDAEQLDGSYPNEDQIIDNHDYDNHLERLDSMPVEAALNESNHVQFVENSASSGS